MKTLKTVSLLLIFSLIPLSVFAAPSENSITDEIPYAANDGNIAPYSYTKMENFSEADAKAAGVPDGYAGYVMKLTGGNSSIGLTIDFSDKKIPISIVKALHMRVYYPDVTKEVRISTDAGRSWELRYAASKPNTWDDVTLEASQMKKLCNADGTVGKFGFGFRLYDGNLNKIAYIDCIYLELVESDGKAPVITYDGATEITMTAGKPLVSGATAYDEGEDRDIPVVAEWEDGALDENGFPKEGVYTCYLVAKDSFGNRSEIKLNVTVKAKDTEAPVINFACDEINTVAGCLPALGITATDNEDEITVEQIWSDGALDKTGRLTEGVHVLTLRAADRTGNATEKTVKVNVYAEFKTSKPIVDESGIN